MLAGDKGFPPNLGTFEEKEPCVNHTEHQMPEAEAEQVLQCLSSEERKVPAGDAPS